MGVIRGDRFTTGKRNDNWTVVDHEQRRHIKPETNWSKETAALIAAALNRHPYHDDQYAWEADS